MLGELVVIVVAVTLGVRGSHLRKLQWLQDLVEMRKGVGRRNLIVGKQRSVGMHPEVSPALHDGIHAPPCRMTE